MYRVPIPTSVETNHQEHVLKLTEDLAYHRGMHAWYRDHLVRIFEDLKSGKPVILELNRVQITVRTEAKSDGV